MARNPIKGSLDKAIAEVAKVAKPDALDKKAEVLLDEENVRDRQLTRTLREAYAGRVYSYLVCYSLAAFLLLVLQGTKYGGFQLDSTVVALIVGSTAVRALGLIGIVVRGLFK